MRTSGAVINCHKAGLGTGNGTYFGMKEILRAAILSGAESIIMIHNHPSGSLIPSKEDCKSADQLIKACKLLGINFLDSIIIGPKGGSYYSLKEHGEIPNDKICYAAFPEQLKFQKTKLTMDTEIPSEEQERE
jgi:DNA repair protein RadC